MAGNPGYDGCDGNAGNDSALHTAHPSRQRIFRLKPLPHGKQRTPSKVPSLFLVAGLSATLLVLLTLLCS